MRLTGQDQDMYPMVKETVKFMDKQLGYKFKDKVVCNLRDHEWVKDRIGIDTTILRCSNNVGQAISFRDMKHLAKVEATPKVQALVFSMETAEQPLGVLFLFDNSCWSALPTLPSEEQYTTLYIYSPFIHRQKNPPINIARVSLGTVGCYPKTNSMYATAKTKMEHQLPNGFRATLKKFYTVIKGQVEAPNKEWGRGYVFTDQKRRLQATLERAVNKNVRTFNDTLEKLFSDHIYEGVAVKAESISKQQYLIRELFKNPERVRHVMETYEQQQGLNLLAEIDKVEDDVALLQKIVCKHRVLHYHGSDKVLHVGEFDEEHRWYPSIDDFTAAIDPMVINKLCILDAAMDRDSGQTPYVAGVGFAMDQAETGSVFGNTFVRMYYLDSQNDEG